MILNERIASRRIILASASPRRQELLRGLGIAFETDTRSHVEETIPPGLSPAETPEYLSRLKSDGFHRPLQADEILVTADTMVCAGDEILGKPTGREDAARMLRKLSGTAHTVYTGVTLRTTDRIRSFTVASEVTFRPLNEDEIYWYIDQYKPFDKAGAYGIQEWIGYAAITGIRGSYFNVMGLPVQRLYDELMQLLA